MPKAKQGETAQPRGAAREHLFIVNLLLIGVAGVGACAWVLAYTNWFPAIGGVLALVGAFSWIAFVSGVLSAERRKQVTALIERVFLDNVVVTIVVLVLLGLGAFRAAGMASVEIVSLQDVPALVTWYGDAADSTGGDTLVINARATERLPVRTGSGAGGRRVRLVVRGLPELTLAPRPRERLSVQIPYSFMRPVLLLLPTPKVNSAFDENPKVFHVRLREQEQTFEGFVGQAVWVGGSEGVEVPQFRRDRWPDQVGDSRNARRVLQLWEFPVTPSGPPIVLAVGDTVHTWLTDTLGTELRRQRFVVRRVAQVRDFPQVEDFDVANE